jgi:hypothetical protein
LKKIVSAIVLWSMSTFSFIGFGYAAETRFSSIFTDLTKECRNAFKAVGEGQDMPLKCKGYGGYYIYIFYSAFASHITINPINGNDGIELATEILSYSDEKGNTIEWRLANSEPFAVILKISKYNDKVQDMGENPYNKKYKIGELLIIKGLKGYEYIDFEVNCQTTADAITQARKLADRAYLKGSP